MVLRLTRSSSASGRMEGSGSPDRRVPAAVAAQLSEMAGLDAQQARPTDDPTEGQP